MLRYDTPADFPNSRPERKLFVMVLLMAIRDGASAVRYRLGGADVDLAYELGGTWDDLVPPPSHIWPTLVAEVRRVARLVRPDRGGWWSRTRPDDPETGWLTFRLLDHDHLFRVHLDARELRLDLFGEPSHSDEAAAALRRLLDIGLPPAERMIEFPAPSEAPRADV